MTPELNYSSVENIPGINARAAFTVNSATVFREDGDITPVAIGKNTMYMPWGVDNQMPYNIIDLIERDETLATCQVFNAEICYGGGLSYALPPAIEVKGEGLKVKDDATRSLQTIRQEVEDFRLENDLASYFLGVCQDFKHFGFAVSVIILNAEGTKVVRLLRKEACYCRFAVADKTGRIPKILYANWRQSVPNEDEIEVIELLDPSRPWGDLAERLGIGNRKQETGNSEPGIGQIPNSKFPIPKTKCRKFAVLTRVPTPDSTYYPIPHYGALFRGKWYNIKQLIGIAKESKLKNSAPIKYQIEISAKYWESIFRAEGITDRRLQQARIVSEKQRILDFLTGAENSGKAWFSTFYVSPDGKEQHDVIINRIDDTKEGGDWESDIQEAVNMICFTMRVHSNLVGSVPGKAQTNNSGSDKRELYTIAQALQKPYHDLLFQVHKIIIKLNKWTGVEPRCPFIQLTTLDEHQDARQADVNT